MFIKDDRIRTYAYRGLKGRYIFQRANGRSAKRVFLVVYGQHATIERCMPIVDALSEFGDVYLVDTPGFGGMEPAYSIGEYPSLDFYSGHLSHVFDTVLPKDKKITLFAVSYGFEITTCFLATHPRYHKRIQDVIGFVGLVSHKEFRISKGLLWIIKNIACRPARTAAGGWFYKHFVFRDWTLRVFYYFYSRISPRFHDLPRSEVWKHSKEQSWLWRVNDTRTHAATAWDFLFVNDLTNLRVDLPVIHIGVPDDHYLDHKRVAEDLKKIYKDVKEYELTLTSHAPVSFDTSDKLLEIIPDELHGYLLKN